MHPDMQLILLLLLGLLHTTAAAFLDLHAPLPMEHGWQAIATAPRDHVVRLTMALKQQNPQRIEEILKEVSDPDHPNYGRYLKHHEITAIVRPSQETMRTISEWLTSHNISSWKFVGNDDFLKV